MTRTQRQRRVRCQLRCEIRVSPRKTVRGRVVSLSDGGLAVVAELELELEQGDPIELQIDTGTRRRTVSVSAIVWNSRTGKSAARGATLRKLGCVVSEPSEEFIGLIDSLAPKSRGVRPVPIPVARPRAAEPEPDLIEPDLPRSREAQPPLKEEPEENLPNFRVRMKQVGGPRTRVLTLRARSAVDAERLAAEELDRASTARGVTVRWERLDISQLVEV